MDISGWGQSFRITPHAPVITPQNHVAAAQAHLATGDRVNAEESYNAAIQLAKAELAKHPSHTREMALARINAEYAVFLAGDHESDASSIQQPLVPINHPTAEAHQPTLSPESLLSSLQADHPEGEIVIQNCQGKFNAPVYGNNNIVKVYDYSVNSETRQFHAVSLDSLRKALYQHYQLSNLSIQRVSGEAASLEDCYINLAIVESQAQREKDKKELEKQAVTFERLPSSERLEATNPNKLIALEKLFDSQKLRDGSEGIPKRILIQGRAGIGKTTLCKKLVYDYQHSALWQDQFDSVLWVPLRQLKTHAPKRLEDLLCTQYFAAYENHQAQALSKVFYTHQDKTLFILDGLDEVVGELNEGRPLKNFLQILLNQAHVVITSRPAGVDAKLLGQLDLELETVGFSPANVQAYIEKCVPASNQTAIQQFIHRTPLIQGLVNIPIQLDALCYSWDKLPQNQEVTMSMLYEAMVDKLWRKDSVRLEKKEVETHVIDGLSEEDLAELMTAEIDYLGYLAFKGLETEKIEFSREELSQRRKELNGSAQSGRSLSLNFTADLKKTSYLHTSDAHRPESERQYHFLHLTFQEFFAAKFLVWHLQVDPSNTERSAFLAIAQTNQRLILNPAKLEAFIAQHKYNPRYEIVWWMVAGLLKGSTLERFFTLLGQAPRDLIGARHQQVIMGCLNEARNQLNSETVLGLEKELERWLRFEMKLSGRSKLGRQRACPEHLLLGLLDQFEDGRKHIIRTLGARPALSEAAVRALIYACQHENAEVRSAAVRALGSQSIVSEIAVQALIGASQDQNADVREAAVCALGSQSTLSEAAMQALIGACQEENAVIREAAAFTLGSRSTVSEAAAQALIGACQDQNEDVREAAVHALGSQNALSEAAVQALIGACQDQNEDVREAAVRALGSQNTLSEAAVQALIRACQDENEDVRSAAVRALGSRSTVSEAAVKALIGACQDQEWSVKSAAAHALGGQSTVSEATAQALIDACQHENEDVRSAAVRALGGQSMASEAAAQALIGASQDQNADVREAAVCALGSQSTASEAAAQALISACQDQEWSVRSAAVCALGSQNALSEAAVQALIRACQNENEDVRYAAASALGGRSTVSEAAVQALIGACQDKNEDVREAAVRALGSQGTLSENAVQALFGACQEENADIRSAAAHALGGQSMVSEAAAQALIYACQHENADVRSEAVRGLGSRSTVSEAAMQVLIGACQDQGWSVRYAAVHALGCQSTLSEVAVQALIGACHEQNRDVREAATGALEKQKTLSEAAVQALIGACQDQNKDVRVAVVRALEKQKTLSEAAVQALIGACQDQNKDVREAAVRALGGQSMVSEAALQALIGACQDQEWSVRYAAVLALGSQSTLSETAAQALIGASQEGNKIIRQMATWALAGQSTLPDTAVRALVAALQDQDETFRSLAAKALVQHLEVIYAVLPGLSPSQIESLYKEFLFNYSCEQIAPLYIQKKQLYFYTAAGPGQPIHLSTDQSEMIMDAFKNAQSEA
ncbi:MAG: HEAT repeat [Glomeribacter sp. 1016415]|nr:HEAT repeat [Glomeribacter sp. 1016415]